MFLNTTYFLSKSSSCSFFPQMGVPCVWNYHVGYKSWSGLKLCRIKDNFKVLLMMQTLWGAGFIWKPFGCKFLQRHLSKDSDVNKFRACKQKCLFRTCDARNMFLNTTYFLLKSSSCYFFPRIGVPSFWNYHVGYTSWSGLKLCRIKDNLKVVLMMQTLCGESFIWKPFGCNVLQRHLSKDSDTCLDFPLWWVKG